MICSLSQPGHARTKCSQPDAQSHRVRRLTEADRVAVQQLLSADPVQTVHLQSLIDDYGLCSPQLRGHFFGYFKGECLAGVALIGHQVMLYAPDEAIDLFAEAAAKSEVKINLIFGPIAQIKAFSWAIQERGFKTKKARDFYWYVCKQPGLPLKELQLQQAQIEHLEMVEEAHAQIFIEATGADPRKNDAEGFRRRVRERIEKGRIWVKVEEGQVIFKAELQSVTPEAIYLEGIWTHHNYRGRGIAKSCVVELTHRRLRKQQTICLVVEPDEKVAQHIYRQAGFEHSGNYQACYFN